MISILLRCGLPVSLAYVSARPLKYWYSLTFGPLETRIDDKDTAVFDGEDVTVFVGEAVNGFDGEDCVDDDVV